MSEHRLQMAAATFLAAVLPRDCYWTSVDAGQGRMDVRAGQMRKARGVKAGFVDILIIYGGHFHGLELKASKGRLSEAQHVAHAQIREAGGKVELCHSIEEVETALRAWDIPLRGTTLTAQQRDERLAAAPKKPRGPGRPRGDVSQLAKFRRAGVIV